METFLWEQAIGELAIARTALSQTAPDVYPLSVPRLAATDQEIQDAEGRLGTSLDPQLCEMLRFVDGWPRAVLDGDILGTADFGQGPLWERSQSKLDLFYEMSEADGLPDRGAIVPIFVSEHQPDVMVIRMDGPVTDGGREVVWVVHDVVDRWPNAYQWLLACTELVKTTTRYMSRPSS